MEYITLNNGVKKPMLSFGVLLIPEETFEQCVFDALDAGYRAFDTAQAYGNEHLLGSALKKSGIPREELFITTKVRPHHYDGQTRQTVLESMEKLQVDYVDLVLLHQPFGDIYAAWRDLETLYEEGKIRAIGVSNFHVKDIEALINATGVVPAVNQIRFFVGNTQNDIYEYCRKNGILIEAYSPLATGAIVENGILSPIAEKYGVSVPRLCIRYCIEKGTLPLPKSVNEARIKENLLVDFKISIEDMEYLDSLYHIGPTRPYRS